MLSDVNVSRQVESKAVLFSGSLVAGVADIVSGTIANQKNYELV